jgi:antitoxin MazE
MPRSSAVKARIVAVGNSQGIRIPKPLLEQAGLEGDVELHAEVGRIVIAAPRRARQGWAQAAAALHARGEDGVLDTASPVFDQAEWDWR